jgi:hypothetical protein
MKIKKNCITCSDFDCINQNISKKNKKKDCLCLQNKYMSWKSKEYGDKLKAFYNKIDTCLWMKDETK